MVDEFYLLSVYVRMYEKVLLHFALLSKLLAKIVRSKKKFGIDFVCVCVRLFHSFT